MANPVKHIQYTGPLQSGMVYYTKEGKDFRKWKVRRRLTIGSRVDGITIVDGETEQEFRDYQLVLASFRKQGLIYVKEK